MTLAPGGSYPQARRQHHRHTRHRPLWPQTKPAFIATYPFGGSGSDSAGSIDAADRRAQHAQIRAEPHAEQLEERLEAREARAEAREVRAEARHKREHVKAHDTASRHAHDTASRTAKATVRADRARRADKSRKAKKPRTG